MIFGGEEKLRKLVESSLELMEGDLFIVISGCVPALIGDDVQSIIKPYKEKTDIIYC